MAARKPTPFVDPTPAAQAKDKKTKEALVSQATDDAAKAEREAAAAARQKTIDALNVEREGYARAGKADRVAQVDAALEATGAKAPAKRRAPSKVEA